MNTLSDPNPSRSPSGWLRPAAWLFYLAIGLEILFMISPAALYFYSLYGPFLNVLDRFAATAWLTQFFLPHLSTTGSFILNGIPWLGGTLVLIGSGWFLAAAGQLYWSQFRRRGLVTTGCYGFSRHPQYTGLALLGFGALLLWPRFLALIAYVLMLFLYRALADLEERSCLAAFGGDYREYQTRTRPILPFLPASVWPSPDSQAGGGPMRASIVPASIGAILLALLIAFAVREYALSQITALYENRLAILSPARLSEAELEAAYRTALEDPGVRRALADMGEKRWVIHVLPDNWHLADLPMETEPGREGHATPANFDRHHYKLLFSRPRSHEPLAQGKDIVRLAYGLQPLLLVRVDIAAGKVTAIETPPSHVWWGDFPTPLF